MKSMSRTSPAQAAVVETIARRQFPPLRSYPEMISGTLPSEWFGFPTLTWAPECLEPNRKPKCVVIACRCVPKVKQYKQRTVEDVEQRTVLYYARYQCTGGAKKSFSTNSDVYLSSSKLFVLNFPYLLTYKTGISSDMFDILYDGMLSIKGIAGAVANVERRRQKRYYGLLSRVGVQVEVSREDDRAYSPLLPPNRSTVHDKSYVFGRRSFDGVVVNSH
ncbi:hypothetical protein L915_02181 [Phytophthora nicotianae]|uniref:Uncharacterized protein n=1 Tax=Phytophthora nicotianae TaxID=4792 RepID=W2HI61_PHYNI|nr:hypothetical protein L915_02181 [Phytophthora nicotianae]